MAAAAIISAALRHAGTSSVSLRLLSSRLNSPFAIAPPPPWHLLPSRLFSDESASLPPAPPSLEPADLWRAVSAAEVSRKTLRRVDWAAMSELLTSFARSAWAVDQALALYLPSMAFPSAVSSFKLFLLPRLPAPAAGHLLSLHPEAAHRLLFPVFAEFCLAHLTEKLRTAQELVAAADLTRPHTWYPFARAMRRRIIYHCGPTNSGKTYNALCRFADARSGIYCSPLRLLAMEVFDKVNALGIYCSLLTGQEKKHVPFANHVACTIEMASTDCLYEVAVIDEIQMLADPVRGYAWTRALLGLQADEIHLCGDPSVVDIVRKICRDTGDDLDVQRYARFKPLVVEAKTLGGEFRNIRKGDCIVAFSRREIFEVKLAIEQATRRKCCVIYGALPPETRRQQASLFNDQDNEYDVLVASDAVGMGLNLNICRVIFYTLTKYNGDKLMPVPASQVKQIAGRAGRRGSVYPEGLVTTFYSADLHYLIECLQQPFEVSKKAGLFPCFEQVEMFASKSPGLTFAELLDKFRENCRLDGLYFFCQQMAIKKVANMLERVKGLSLQDRYNFCFAPVNIRDPKAMYHLLRFATNYSLKKPVNIAMGTPKDSAKNDAELLDLETKHQVVSMYLWLSQHFEQDHFPQVQKAETMATNIADLLAKSLAKARWKPASRSQGRPKLDEGESEEGKEQKVAENDVFERPKSLVQAFLKRREDRQSQNSSTFMPT